METTFLTEEQIWGDNALDVIKEYGVKTSLSDLTIVLGGYMGSNTTSDGIRTGFLWSASSDGGGSVRAVAYAGVRNWLHPSERLLGGRPALPSSITSKISPSATRASSSPKATNCKIEFRQYGEYPQTITSDNISKELECDFNAKKLRATGNKYTFDAEAYDAYDKPFQPRDLPEYEYQGKRYIRVLANPRDSDYVLSNGKKPAKDEPCWIEVQPIDWMVDKKTGIWVAHKALFAGVKFSDDKSYDGNFSKTNMKKYLDKYFTPQMQQGRTTSRDFSKAEEDSEHDKWKDSKRRIGHGIEVVEEPLSVKEQIDFYVKNGMSFMLHGPSGVGKTDRVYQIDENLTKLRLVNGILPEDVIGKVIYPNGAVGLPPELITELLALEKQLKAANPGLEQDNTPSPAKLELAQIRKIIESQPKEIDGGKWVAPDWYKDLTKKCEAEPKKQHIFFIDEITNAKPTTQSLVFHIVLEKSISNDKGQLPKNAVVVLAGNSKDESGAAYNMPAPLFRRMAGHIYLDYNIPDWLEWASEKSRKHKDDPSRLNAHPLVSSFIAANPEAFFSDYNEENPQKFAIDPRGWEMVSDIIYNNDGRIHRELFANKIGNDMATNLLAFAKNPPLSLEEILSGEYSKNDIPEMADAKLALALNLRHANEKQVGKVREFIDSHFGRENRAIYDSVWAGKNDDRALQLAQMQFLKNNGRR